MERRDALSRVASTGKAKIDSIQVAGVGDRPQTEILSNQRNGNQGTKGTAKPMDAGPFDLGTIVGE